MRQSHLFTKTIKETPKDEASRNARLLIRGGFVNKLGAGIYTLLPLGLRVHEKIATVIREEINKLGAQEVLMPALVPKEAWEATGRWKDIDVLFKVQGGDEREYGLGATHEEVVTPLVKNFAGSYKDLPTAVYQIQTKFRNELRAKGGLLRGREFSMKDLYSFHTTQASLDEFYDQATEAYRAIYRRLGLGEKTYMTYASGGAFSKYSHEFQAECEAGEDTIYVCDECRVAVNKEIISEQPACPQCGNKSLRETTGIEIGNIFKLGDRFSKAVDYLYMDENGQRQPVIMGCYGIGLGRLMATIAEIQESDEGIVWPSAVAPFSVHLIALTSADEKVRQTADMLYADFQKRNIEVLYDDRSDASAGAKFADADLIGCPLRMVVSEKTLARESVEMKKRSGTETRLLTLAEAMKLTNQDVQ